MTTSLTHSSIFFFFFFCINPPSMISGLKAVAWRGKIVITGGWNGTRRLNSCYSHDPKHKGWHRLGDLNTARSNHSLTVVADQLVVAGGYDGTSTTAVVEVYDPELNIWRVVSPLAARRSALASCSVPLSALERQLREQLVSPDRWLARQQQLAASSNEQPGGSSSSQEEMEGLETDAEFEMFDDSDLEDDDAYDIIDWEGHNLSDEDSDAD